MDTRVRSGAAGNDPIGAAVPGFERMPGRLRQGDTDGFEEDTMGKTGRKRRARKKKGANHGKRPNA